MCEIVLTAKHSVLRFIPPPFRGRHDLASFHAPNVVCNVSIVSNVRVTLKNTDTMPHRCQHLFQHNQQGLDSHVGLAKLRYANTLPSESIGNALWANSAGRTVGRKSSYLEAPAKWFLWDTPDCRNFVHYLSDCWPQGRAQGRAHLTLGHFLAQVHLPCRQQTSAIPELNAVHCLTA